MWRNMATMMLFGGMIGIAGCGKPAAPASASKQQDRSEQVAESAGPTAETPQGAVDIFLSAVCSGNDEHAAGMLTDLARQKTAEMELEVAPPGSDTAQFQIGEVQVVGDDAARVACIWSDLDEAGARAEEQIVWVLRREAAGWRIAGMAPTIFPGEPPLLLNFEEPEEMLEKLQWVQEEAMRRAQAEVMQAEHGAQREAQRREHTENEIRR